MADASTHDLALALLILVLVVLAGGYAAIRLGHRVNLGPFGNVAVRCRDGHVFTTTWIPMVSVTALRLGPVRFQYCPVGRHWSFVTRVQDSDPLR